MRFVTVVGASPHTRGWTRRYRARRAAGEGFPRTRGDGPMAGSDGSHDLRASPHTRGWTLLWHTPMNAGEGFPAHAGMDRLRARPDHRGARLPPHTRGWTRIVQRLGAVQRGFPAHAGMDRIPTGRSSRRSRLPRTRGDGPSVALDVTPTVRASPHTRGWTRQHPALEGSEAGFPAHAGMDRGYSGRPAARAGLPRTRGDGPCQQRM